MYFHESENSNSLLYKREKWFSNRLSERPNLEEKKIL